VQTTHFLHTMFFRLKLLQPCINLTKLVNFTNKGKYVKKRVFYSLLDWLVFRKEKKSESVVKRNENWFVNILMWQTTLVLLICDIFLLISSRVVLSIHTLLLHPHSELTCFFLQPFSLSLLSLSTPHPILASVFF